MCGSKPAARPPQGLGDDHHLAAADQAVGPGVVVIEDERLEHRPAGPDLPDGVLLDLVLDAAATERAGLAAARVDDHQGARLLRGRAPGLDDLAEDQLAVRFQGSRFRCVRLRAWVLRDVQVQRWLRECSSYRVGGELAMQLQPTAGGGVEPRRVREIEVGDDPSPIRRFGKRYRRRSVCPSTRSVATRKDPDTRARERRREGPGAATDREVPPSVSRRDMTRSGRTPIEQPAGLVSSEPDAVPVAAMPGADASFDRPGRTIRRLLRRGRPQPRACSSRVARRTRPRTDGPAGRRSPGGIELHEPALVEHGKRWPRLMASPWSWVTWTRVEPNRSMELDELARGARAERLVEARERLVQEQDGRPSGHGPPRATR